MMTPLELAAMRIACRRCAQQPGEECKPLTESMHEERKEDAAALMTGGNVTKAEFDKAAAADLFGG